MPGSQLISARTLSDGIDGNGSGDVGMVLGRGDLPFTRNPLMCCLCNDYYTDPCLLQCFHTFCLKCLRGRELDGRISCPICGNLTSLDDHAVVPPPDNLMKQLIELVNTENPPCANCDKRDKNAMYYCSTCGQSLCNECRENTHRAKMFSTHDIVHMSKCTKDSEKRCPAHGELYVMFNNVQRSMLCVTCFRDAPNETRMHCVDIDAAYTQTTKKLDRAIIVLCEVQNAVREGLHMFKTHLEELRHNMDCEKHTINTFWQGMQESIAKTHSNMIMEVQRQYDTKERSFRGHLVNLGIILPVIQLHLLLCRCFTNIANKYQFLDLATSVIDRLSAISQFTQPQRPVQSSQIKTNYRNEFAQSLEPWLGKTYQSPRGPVQQGSTNLIEQFNAFSLPASTASLIQSSKRHQSAVKTKAVEGEGPFSNHCRSFDSQIKELSQQLSLIKERLNDLHRDVSVLRRAQTPPLISRYQRISGDCSILEEQLERHKVELERMKNVFDTLWEEQLCRIHAEQDIFQSQTNEITSLRAEVKHLATVTQQLEPHIKSLINMQIPQSGCHKTQEHKIQETNIHSQQLQALLDHISALQLESGKSYSQSVATKTAVHPKEGKERPKMSSQDGGPAIPLDSTRNAISESQKIKQLNDGSAGSDKRGGVLSQLIDKVRTKDDRKKSSEDRDRITVQRDRSKSAEIVRTKGIDDSQNAVNQRQPNAVTKNRGKKDTKCKDGKTTSIYQSISGKVLGTRSEPAGMDVDNVRREVCLPPPPPPARRIPLQEQAADIKERLEIHLKEKLQHMGSRGNVAKFHAARADHSRSLEVEDCRRVSKALSRSTEDVKNTRVLVHRDPQNSKVPSTSTSPRRQDGITREKPVERERSRERWDKRDRSRDARDKSRDEKERSKFKEERERSRERRVRRDKYGRYYPASDTEDHMFYHNGFDRKQNSFDSLTLSPPSADSRKSSADLGDRKTLVLVIGNRKGSTKQKLSQKQRSWETFPPKRKNHDADNFGGRSYRHSGSYSGRVPSAQEGRHSLERTPRTRAKNCELTEGVLRKADSFEGHEEAVRTLVAAVHQTRTQQLQKNRKAKATGGHLSS